jgi:hypothetical protein
MGYMDKFIYLRKVDFMGNTVDQCSYPTAFGADPLGLVCANRSVMEVSPF